MKQETEKKAGYHSSTIHPINIKELQERENYSEYEEYSHHGTKLRGIFTQLKPNTVLQVPNTSIYSIPHECGKTQISRLAGNRKHKHNTKNGRNI
jgi:hypothetical protein